MTRVLTATALSATLLALAGAALAEEGALPPPEGSLTMPPLHLDLRRFAGQDERLRYTLHPRLVPDAGDAQVDRSGWVRSPGELGMGDAGDGQQTVLGLYQRPPRPDIPPRQTSELEGQGAAGLSLSFKLGQ